MGAGHHGRGELIKHRLHGGRAHLGENQGHAVVAVRADGAEQIDGLVAQVASATGADALLEPTPAGAAGLADPGLVENQTWSPGASGWAASISAISAGNFFLLMPHHYTRHLRRRIARAAA